MAKLNRSEERESFWRMVLEEHRHSGLNIRQFCKREGLGEASFYFWRREIEDRDRQRDSAGAGSAMIPVKVVQPNKCKTQNSVSTDRVSSDQASTDQAVSAPDGPSIEVVTPTGFVIRAGRCDEVMTNAVVRLAHALADHNKNLQVTSC